MLPIIGIVVCFYVFTRSMEIVLDWDGREDARGRGAVMAFAVITMLVALLGGLLLAVGGASSPI